MYGWLSIYVYTCTIASGAALQRLPRAGSPSWMTVVPRMRLADSTEACLQPPPCAGAWMGQGRGKQKLQRWQVARGHPRLRSCCCCHHQGCRLGWLVLQQPARHQAL